MTAKDELERIVKRAYAEWYGTGTYHGTIMAQQLPGLIFDAKFVRLEDVEIDIDIVKMKIIMNDICAGCKQLANCIPCACSILPGLTAKAISQAKGIIKVKEE